MTAVLVDVDASADVFDLDVRVETDRVHTDLTCQTDDGCGQTCQLSACNSQS